MSFDPFADFTAEPAQVPAPASAPVVEPVAPASTGLAQLDPFSTFNEAPVEPVAEPEFKVTISPEPATTSKSGFSSAHQFASPDHTVGEGPERIPVTPIKGDTSGVPLNSNSTPATVQSAAPTITSTPAAVDPSTMAHAGELEKLAEGFLGEKWNMRWCGVKHNRFGYYNSKVDARPKGFVFFDEADVGIPSNLAHTAEYQYAIQISHERKNLNWFFRAPNAEIRKKWLGVMSANIKHYKSLNAEPTILERVLSMACVKDQVTSAGLERSFHFYTSKTSSGFYAVILCVLMELLVRKIIDLANTDEIILSPNATFTGMGLFDDTLDLIAAKVKASPTKSVKITEILPVLLYAGGFVGSLGYSLGPDAFLSDPVLRAIDHATRRGTLEKHGPKRWTVKNTQLEDQTANQLRQLINAPYEGSDIKDHVVIGICYTLLRAASKSPGADQQQHDVLDRLKIFPDLPTNAHMEQALDKMAKHLGSFEKKQATLLKIVHGAMTDFILGPAPK